MTYPTDEYPTDEEMLDEFLRYTRQARDRQMTTIATFADTLLANPQGATEWAGDAFRAAAVHRIADRVIKRLEEFGESDQRDVYFSEKELREDEEVPIRWYVIEVLQPLQREVLTFVRGGIRHTRPTSTAAGEELASATQMMVEQLEGLRDRMGRINGMVVQGIRTDSHPSFEQHCWTAKIDRESAVVAD